MKPMCCVMFEKYEISSSGFSPKFSAMRFVFAATVSVQYVCMNARCHSSLDAAYRFDSASN